VAQSKTHKDKVHYGEHKETKNNVTNCCPSLKTIFTVHWEMLADAEIGYTNYYTISTSTEREL